MFPKLMIALTLFTVCVICPLIHHLGNFHWITCLSFFVAAGLTWPHAQAARLAGCRCPAQQPVLTVSALPSVFVAVHMPSCDTFGSFSCSVSATEESLYHAGSQEKISRSLYLLFLFFPGSSMHIGKEKEKGKEKKRERKSSLVLF